MYLTKDQYIDASRKRGVPSFVPVGVTAIPVLDFSEKRVRIAFANGGASLITVFNKLPTASGNGWPVLNTLGYLEFDIADYGSLVMEEWFSIAAAAGQTLSIIEVFRD